MHLVGVGYAVLTRSTAFWVVLSFVAMLMPAIACFSKLKRDKRHTYRNAVPTVSQTWVDSDQPCDMYLQCNEQLRRRWILKKDSSILAKIPLVHDVPRNRLLLAPRRSR